jgi:hypothetical protein
MRLGPYEIVAPIGVGGMGEVYRAHDRRLARDVAVKVLPPAFRTSSEWLERFEQEARAAGALAHPNILAVHDIGRHDGAPYVVSELLEGATLRERLQSGPLPTRKAIEYAIQIAHGLAAAHDRGIVHRDIKPENLFLTRDGRVKILDFGLAKLVPAALADQTTVPMQTHPGSVLGTVGYMSPEQVRGQSADHRSDVFSFGAVLYEMLSGRRAFRGDSNADTMSAILHQDPPELAATGHPLPPALDQIVRHCLEKNAGERFQSAHDLAFNLEALSGMSVSRVPALEGERRRRPPAWLIWAVPLLTLLGAAALWVALRRGGSPAASTSFRRLTFGRGFVPSARFAPDGKTVVYAAAWDGAPAELFSTRTEARESRPLGLSGATVAAISPTGEMAITLRSQVFWGGVRQGTLARASLAGGAPRELAEDVLAADFVPGSEDLAVIRREQGMVRLELPLGHLLAETEGWFSHPRLSPRGDLVAVVHHPMRWDDQGALELYDRAGKRRVLTHTFASAVGLAWSPHGDEIWFSAAESGEARALWAVTPAGKLRPLLRVPGGVTLQDVAPTGEALLTRDDVRARIVVMGSPGDATAGTRPRELNLEDFSLPADLSADGRVIVGTEQGEGSGKAYSIFLRRLDSSHSVRLGSGTARALSPDGRWVAALAPGGQGAMLLPTGAGSPHPLGSGGLTSYDIVGFFPDGEHLLVVAARPGHATRCWAQSTRDGALLPLTVEGTECWLISHDGSQVLASGPQAGAFALVTLRGGVVHPVLGLEPDDLPAQWAESGQTLYVRAGRLSDARVYRVDLTSGKRELWNQITVPDGAGVLSIGGIKMTRDGATWVYGYMRLLTDLYLVEGLR